MIGFFFGCSVVVLAFVCLVRLWRRQAYGGAGEPGLVRAASGGGLSASAGGLSGTDSHSWSPALSDDHTTTAAMGMGLLAAGAVASGSLFDDSAAAPGMFDSTLQTGTCINPASGLPMVSGDTSGIDVGGNVYGCNNDSFDSSSLFDSGVSGMDTGCDWSSSAESWSSNDSGSDSWSGSSTDWSSGSGGSDDW